jgi:hypothetical protein
VREQLLQAYISTVNKPPCDAGGVRWLEDNQQKTTAGTLTLPDRVKAALTAFRRGPLCSPSLGIGIGR